MKKKERFEIRIKIIDRERTVSIIDTADKEKVIQSVTIPRMPFSGGHSPKRTEMENLCKRMNEDDGNYQKKFKTLL